MAKFRTTLNSFTMGEVSSKFFGRSDLKEYSQSCRDLENSWVRQSGGAFRRPGSRYVTNQVNGENIAGNVRLIDWVISNEEAYIIAISAPGYATSDQINIYRLSDSTWYAGGHIAGYGFSETWLDYTSAQLPEIKAVQYHDRVLLLHPDHVPVWLNRMNATDFVYHHFLRLVPLYPGATAGSSAPGTPVLTDTTVPYRDMNTDTDWTMTPGATSGTTTLTSSKAIFTANHVGSTFRLLDTGSGTEGWCIVTAYTSSTVVTVVIESNFGTTAATSSWWESSWSYERGWPRTATFYQSRLIYAGNETQPNNVWGTKTGNIFTLKTPTVGALDTDAFQFTLADNENNAAQWLVAGKNLFHGSSGKERILYGSDQNTAISTSNIQSEIDTNIGSVYVQPLKFANSIMFVQRNGLKIRELSFDWGQQSYVAKDMHAFADHMSYKAYYYYASVTDPQIIQLAKIEGETPLIFSLDNNGVLNVLSRDKELGTMAWTPIKLGGNFGGEPPKVISMCALPSLNGLDDDLWLLVKRTVNSSTVYYIERIGKEFFQSSLDPASCSSAEFYPFYSDCSIVQTLGSAGVTFNGFAKLAGETVSVMADGLYVGTKVVSSLGVITLDGNATTVIAGYSYRNTVSPLVPDVGSQVGSRTGTPSRLSRIMIRFRRTVSAKFGRDDSSNLETLNFRSASDSITAPIPLFTGLGTPDQDAFDFSGEYDGDPQAYILNDYPQPMEVSAVTFEGMSYD